MNGNRADAAAVDGRVESPDHASPSRSDVISLLAHPRRRRALERLRAFDEPIGLADLADEVATAEYGTIISEIPAEAVKRVYLDLYHSHVPKLAEADVVEYGQESDLIELSAGAERLAPYMEAAGE